MKKPKPIDVDHEILRIIKQIPATRGRLKREPSSGCLLYIGPVVGSIEGNPVVITPKGKSMLRRAVWEMHHAGPTKGKRVAMSCGNHRCQWIKHMYLTKQSIVYRHPKIRRGYHLPDEEILVIRYFGKRINTHALAQLFRVTGEFIRSVLAGKSRPNPKLPQGFRPARIWYDRIEEESSRSSRISPILNPKEIRQSRNDIRLTPLGKRERDVLLRATMGESILSILQKYPIPRGNIYNIRSRALVRVWRAVGPREWIRKATKGKITKWLLTYYDRKPR